MPVSVFNLKSSPHHHRRFVLQALGLTGLALMASQPLNAQSNWPSKPIKLVIPFAPGGVTDTSGRIIADYLSKKLGQQVVADNRPGASGNIGSQVVATSEPDGHTLLLVLDGTFVINPHVYDKVPFDPLRDFSPIGKIGDSTTMLVAHPSFKANSLRELIELSKSQPGGVSYGTSGTGSIVHLAGEIVKQRIWFTFPTKGAHPPSLTRWRVIRRWPLRLPPRSNITSRQAISRRWACRLVNARASTPTSPPSLNRGCPTLTSIRGSAWSRQPKPRGPSLSDSTSNSMRHWRIRRFEPSSKPPASLPRQEHPRPLLPPFARSWACTVL